MSKRFLLLVTAMVLCMFVFVGCSGDDGKDANVDEIVEKVKEELTGENDYAGANACLTCHTGLKDEYVLSKHVTHSTHVSAASDKSCLVCHDPLDEGYYFESDVSAVPAGGLAVVSCEACHGKASDHVSSPGKYSPEFAKPALLQCGSCHSGLPSSHVSGTYLQSPYADMISERFESGRHTGEVKEARDYCLACHSHEGFVARNIGVREVAKTRGDITKNFVAPAVEEFSIKTCSTCHDAHTTELRSVETTATLGGNERVVFSQQFNLCTACHQIVLDYEFDATAGHNARGMIRYSLAEVYEKAAAEGMTDEQKNALDYHANVSNPDKTIADTHFSGKFGEANVVGYNVNPGSATACSDCHDVHSANALFHENAQAFGEGFGKTHGNYIADPFSSVTYPACAPCHNGEHIVRKTVGGSPDTTQWASLGCVTCHDLVNTTEDFDISARRTYPEDYKFEFESGATVTPEELGANQTCFECHKGRYGLKETAETATQVYDVNYLHYLPVFATLFGAAAEMHYMYDGKEYADRFEHGFRDIIGVADGKMGCTDCHEVHTADSYIQKTGTSCASCHTGGTSFDVATLEAKVKEYGDRLFNTILTQIDPALLAAQATTEANTPAKQLKVIITASAPATTNVGNADLAKAASIWRDLMYYDPAAWAHNSKFAKQLMYDAVEALNGDLTGLTRPQ